MAYCGEEIRPGDAVFAGEGTWGMGLVIQVGVGLDGGPEPRAYVRVRWDETALGTSTIWEGSPRHKALRRVVSAQREDLGTKDGS